MRNGSLRSGSAVEDQAGRAVVVLNLDDRLLELVRVGFLRLLLLGVIIRALAVALGLAVRLAGEGIDGVGVALPVLAALVLQVLAQHLDRSARQLLAVVLQPYAHDGQNHKLFLA